MVLLGMTVFLAARRDAPRWRRVGAVGLGAAVVVAVSNSLEHCASAPLGIPYVLGLLVTLATTIALGGRLVSTPRARGEGAGLLVVGVAAFPLGDNFAFGFAAGLTLFGLATLISARSRAAAA
jgi:hypothetical protein